MTSLGSDAAFYLRFAAAGLAIAGLFVVGSLALGNGLAGASDGLFAVGVVTAAVAALFTRPSVLRKRSIREAEADEESASDGDARASDGDARASDGDDGRTGTPPAPRPADGGRDPARQVRIGVGLIVLAAVSLASSIALALLG